MSNIIGHQEWQVLQTFYLAASIHCLPSTPTTAYNQYKLQRILSTNQTQPPLWNHCSLCLCNKQVHEITQRTHVDQIYVAVLNQRLRKEANYYINSISCKLVILSTVVSICYSKHKHTTEYMFLNKASVVNNFIANTIEKF